MKIKIALSLVASFLLVASPSWAGTYKCTDANGQIGYQQTPCAKTKSSTSQVEVKTRAPTRPFAQTKKNKKLLAYYTIYENQKVIVNACVNQKSSYAGDISQAHQRYSEIAEENITKGREIFERGLVGLPSSEMRSIQRKAKSEKNIELRALKKKKLDRLCSSHAGKLRRIAGQVTNRTVGYQEGDLDPEGND